jgi:ADP-ribosylglycohydrolase
LAGRYPNDFEAALIANTNVGGDNCHRGAVLGAILGAGLGFEAIPKAWVNGLTAHQTLHDEIEQFIARFE